MSDPRIRSRLSSGARPSPTMPDPIEVELFGTVSH
jgi:hypothetical protein